jgi:hypothetical protein
MFFRLNNLFELETLLKSIAKGVRRLKNAYEKLIISARNI